MHWVDAQKSEEAITDVSIASISTTAILDADQRTELGLTQLTQAHQVLDQRPSD